MILKENIFPRHITLIMFNFKSCLIISDWRFNRINIKQASYQFLFTTLTND